MAYNKKKRNRDYSKRLSSMRVESTIFDQFPLTDDSVQFNDPDKGGAGCGCTGTTSKGSGYGNFSTF